MSVAEVFGAMIERSEPGEPEDTRELGELSTPPDIAGDATRTTPRPPAAAPTPGRPVPWGLKLHDSLSVPTPASGLVAQGGRH